LIVAPLANHLDHKRLLIVADGALEYLPFGALPEPDSTTTVNPSSPPLIVNHEVVMLPSASVVAVLREQRANRRAAAKSVAVFADPVLTLDDPRVNGDARTAVRRDDVGPVASEVAVNDVIRAAKDTGRASFERLPYSALEADAIASLVAPGNALKATGFGASRAQVLSRDLSDYRILHFATHGIVDSQRPELSGVVLSLVDDRGQPQDGFLRLHDIYDLDLKADLVVLSACGTALGREIKGDGLVGLTRGFMHAGAPRIVASLWEVRDRATAELMTRFYRGVLREGVTPAAALRQAQISMWKDPRWSAPFYWAAFVLQGEWR
jgi:CHAT domain-containing protein